MFWRHRHCCIKRTVSGQTFIIVVIITRTGEKTSQRNKLNIAVIRVSDSFKWVKFMQNFEHGVSFQPIKNNISVYLFAVVNNC